jgi:hypothetical protein
MNFDRKALSSSVVVAALFLSVGSLAASKKKSPPRAEVKDVVELVSNSLAQACAAEENKNMCGKLSEIVLTLHTEIDKDGRVGVTLFGFSIGGHREKDTYNEFSVTLKLPPAEAALTPTTGVKVSDALIQAFKNFLDASAAARNGKFALTATGFYLELGFTVQYGGGIGTTGLNLVPVSPDISGKVERRDVQTIRFTFGQ